MAEYYLKIKYMIEFKTRSLNFTRNQILDWCEANVSPRTYWIHNKIGGAGWQFYKKSRHEQWYLMFEDDETATVFKLTL